MHHGSILSSQLKYVFSQFFGTNAVSPFATASRAGLANVSASTNHWSVSIGSMTTFERSPKGCMMGFASTRGIIPPPPPA